MEAAWVLGCTLFQGQHLARAQVVESPTLTPGRLHCLRLLGMLAQPDVSFEDIEELVRVEPVLAVRLLTVVNSTVVGAQGQITSLQEALVTLGLSQLREWLQLMVFADVAGESSELCSAALVRARACEMLAAGRAGMDTETAFTTGLVSSLGPLLDQPLEWILARMELGEDLQSPLTTGEGPLGELLDVVRRYEQGAAPSGSGDYASVELVQAFLAGVEWWRRREPAVFEGRRRSPDRCAQRHRTAVHRPGMR
jgi:EAL and modified HD-GYP domain-containing signal transduction protein